MSKALTAEFKTHLADTEANLEQHVAVAAHQAWNLLASIDTRNLGAAGSGEVAALHHQLAAEVDRFGHTYPDALAAGATQVKSLRQMNLIRRAGQVALVVFGLLLIPKSFMLGLGLIGIALGVRAIGKRQLVARARTIASEAQAPIHHVLAVIGRPEEGLHEASGLCARADLLYLAGLDPTARMMEQQRRQSARQMAQMQAQHEAQMAQQQAAMAQQQALMEAVLAENEATNDALYGPSIFRSAMRGYDRAKRHAAA